MVENDSDLKNVCANPQAILMTYLEQFFRGKKIKFESDENARWIILEVSKKDVVKAYNKYLKEVRL